MKTTIEWNQQTYTVDLDQPIDLSISISGNDQKVLAWYIDYPTIQPVQIDDFIGSVDSGKSSTNFRTITFNPHAHGTHTECLGHITKEIHSVNQLLKKNFFIATLISIHPQKKDNDWQITKELLQQKIDSTNAEALIIRTLPNPLEKTHTNYCHTNPPYLTEEAMQYIVEKNIQHLLIDLPSVDKEKDDGLLIAHKTFWNVQNTQKVNTDARWHATITEFIYVPTCVEDGHYLLNLQTAAFENDAVPSRPILFKLSTKE